MAGKQTNSFRIVNADTEVGRDEDVIGLAGIENENRYWYRCSAQCVGWGLVYLAHMVRFFLRRILLLSSFFSRRVALDSSLPINQQPTTTQDRVTSVHRLCERKDLSLNVQYARYTTHLELVTITPYPSSTEIKNAKRKKERETHIANPTTKQNAIMPYLD
jgi:hypothetical protein